MILLSLKPSRIKVSEAIYLRQRRGSVGRSSSWELATTTSTKRPSRGSSKGKLGGLLLVDFFPEHQQNLALAALHKIPTIYTNRGLVEAGGLMS
jgi:hypothetical protein